MINKNGGAKMYNILIIEDETGISESIKSLASQWDLECHIVGDFRNVMKEFAECAPHLVLLDISLPFFNGYHWCEEIRKVSKVPIIFISSASDNMNIIMAMNMGADDFIIKPFDGSVLMAKINAMLRRSYNFAPSSDVKEHRGAILNISDGTMTYGEENIDLTKNEYRILLTLLENKGKVVSREKLMDALWKTDNFIDENTLTVNVGRLRKKLDSAGLCDFITTKFGVGYIIN